MLSTKAPPVRTHADASSQPSATTTTAVIDRTSLIAELAGYLRPDIVMIGILAVYCALLVPMIPRWTDNVAMLASFTNDEPFITQQLDGMTVAPYGNPSNFLEPENAARIPAYWMNYRYYNLIYYGGTYLDAGFVVYMPLKALGAPPFPTAPIVLRIISFLSGFLALALLYGFGRRWIGRFGGAVACMFLMFQGADGTSPPQPSWFIYMASTVHPDMLQLLLTMLCLVLAVRQARLGDLRSLLVLGALVGVIQGTKSGAPYTLPMVAVATAIGAWRQIPRERPHRLATWAAMSAARMTGIGAVAVGAFVATTPYILFDPYYIRTTRAQYLLLTGESPLIPISSIDWYAAIVREVTWPAVVAIVLAVTWFAARGLRRLRWPPPLVLALVLGASNLVWFTSVARFWVALYYVLAATALLALFLGDLLERIRAAIASAGLPGKFAAALLVALTLINLGLGNNRGASVVESVAQRIASDRTPQLMLANWAEKNLPANSSILFDDEAYFDPGRFPLQRTNAGVMRYLDVLRKHPQYIVLTDYPTASNWIMAKRATQKLDMWSDDPYSVRLYQDLIDSNPQPYTPGPTPNKYFQLLDVVGVPWLDRASQPESFKAFDAVYRAINPSYTGLQEDLSSLHRLLLYRVDPAFYDQVVPGVQSAEARIISSPSAPGYDPAAAFDGTGKVWLAAATGPDVDGAYIGVSFPMGRPEAIRTVTVRWVADTWLPSRIAIQYSDDGVSWSSALAQDEHAPPASVGAPGTKRWMETISLPDTGAHQFWRLTALQVSAGGYFGVDELSFLR